MSLNRFAAKVDASADGIVKALREAHVQVWVIRSPCDLLLRFWCTKHEFHCWQTLEIKPPKSDGTPKMRADQLKQAQFLEDTLTPVAATFDQALQALNWSHTVGIS